MTLSILTIVTIYFAIGSTFFLLETLSFNKFLKKLAERCDRDQYEFLKICAAKADEVCFYQCLFSWPFSLIRLIKSFFMPLDQLRGVFAEQFGEFTQKMEAHRKKKIKGE